MIDEFLPAQLIADSVTLYTVLGDRLMLTGEVTLPEGDDSGSGETESS